MKKGKITQISEGENKLTIEMTGFFTELEEVIKKYEQKAFLKEDIRVILADYSNQVISLKELEQLRERVKQLTSHILPNDKEATRLVKTMLSIRKNIKTTNRNDVDFVQGLLKGTCSKRGMCDIMKIALEGQGIESNVIQTNGQVVNEVKLKKWYEVDVVNSKKSLTSNIGKYIKRKNKTQERYSSQKAQEQVSNRIKKIAQKAKQSVPNLNFKKQNLLQTITSLWNKKQETLALPEPSRQEKSNMQIMDYSPAGMIGDNILWEINTWEKADVKNRVMTNYVLLPRIGTPQQIYQKEPEAFTKIFKELSKTAEGKSMPFIGSIQLEEQSNAWSAYANDSQEMQKIEQQVAELIKSKIQANQVVAEFKKQYEKQQEVRQMPQTQKIDSTPKAVRQPIKKEPRKVEPAKRDVNQKVEKETIVISDLHSNVERWNLVRKKINENTNLQVIILGDAMDRGSYGVEILLQIKELSDSGKVKYLPGNHDEFAYNCIRGELEGQTNNEVYKRARWELLNNKGKETYQKLTNFSQTITNALEKGYIKNQISIEQFINWLGSQPIQMTARQKGNDYALAHAFFDNKLYEYDKNFNLAKAYDLQKNGKTTQNSELMQRFKNTLWYRAEKEQTQCGPISWPQRYAMIVGHTSQEMGVNMKLFNQDFMKPMIYVDCGKYKSLGAFNLNGKEIEDLSTWKSSKQPIARQDNQTR